MRINIDDAAREYILKKGGNVRILIQSCHSGGG